MPGPLLHLGASVLCSHGGQAMPAAPNPRVLVSGQAVATMAAPYLVAGCAFVPPGGNGPCVSATWMVAATRVLVAGQPAVLLDSQAVCAPTGTPLLPVMAQMRVIGADAMTMMNVAYPYRVDGRGRSAEAASDDAHIRDLIEQLLFTVPGERVNRPDFGCGLLQLVFAPNSPELAATLQMLVQGALQQWLGTLIQVDDVQADSSESTLTVDVSYTVVATQVGRSDRFTHRVST